MFNISSGIGGAGGVLCEFVDFPGLNPPTKGPRSLTGFGKVFAVSSHEPLQAHH